MSIDILDFALAGPLLLEVISVDVLAFGLGALLLLVGILGGGFEIKELKIPKVGLIPRLFTLLAGSCFVVLGIGLNGTKAPTTPMNNPVVNQNAGNLATPASREEPVKFRIDDQLGENEFSEQVTILLDGERVGTLQVNEEYPNSMITVTVPQSGRYSYTAEAKLAINDNGDRVECTGAGQGSINVKPGKSFDVRASLNSSNTCLITLEEKP